ncbi:unnamed protein product, partial [Prunus brigantina]
LSRSTNNSFGLQQWEPRATFVLQTAWRRYKREKLQKSPRQCSKNRPRRIDTADQTC